MTNRGSGSELKEAEERLAHLATVDELTQVANKRAFRERFRQLVLEGQRGRKFALVMADIDHFKRVNDSWGHPEGDCVLRGFADTLVKCLRSIDFVARVGGEEFAILLTDVDETTSLLLAERLREMVQTVRAPQAITASFGICCYAAAPDATGDALLAAADQALYDAKAGGRNRVVVHRHDLASSDTPAKTASVLPHAAEALDSGRV